MQIKAFVHVRNMYTLSPCLFLIHTHTDTHTRTHIHNTYTVHTYMQCTQCAFYLYGYAHFICMVMCKEYPLKSANRSVEYGKVCVGSAEISTPSQQKYRQPNESTLKSAYALASALSCSSWRACTVSRNSARYDFFRADMLLLLCRTVYTDGYSKHNRNKNVWKSLRRGAASLGCKLQPFAFVLVLPNCKI